jgi:putative hydrolase of HD superfamily
MEKLFEFFELSGRLKTLRRKGWQIRGIEDAESVSDHSYQLALMALVLAEKHPDSVNRDHCVALALVHDLGEAIVGDITPHDGISEDDKHQRELEAIRQIDELIELDVESLWNEFEACETPEAQFVKSLDKFEMWFQARTYEASTDKKENLQDFWGKAELEVGKGPNSDLLPDPWVRGMVADLLKQRSET